MKYGSKKIDWPTRQVVEKALLVLGERGIQAAKSCEVDPLNDPDVKAVVLATGPGSSGTVFSGDACCTCPFSLNMVMTVVSNASSLYIYDLMSQG